MSYCVGDGSAVEESSLPLRSAIHHNLNTFSTSQTEVECIASPPNLAMSSSNQRKVKSIAHASDIAISSTSQNQNKIKVYSNNTGEWPSSFNRDYWIAKESSEVQHMKTISCHKRNERYNKENKPRFC